MVDQFYTNMYKTNSSYAISVKSYLNLNIVYTSLHTILGYCNMEVLFRKDSETKSVDSQYKNVLKYINKKSDKVVRRYRFCLFCGYTVHILFHEDTYFYSYLYSCCKSKIRQWPTLPPNGSTIGAERLNFFVRNG